MESSVEYLFADDIRIADQAARRQGWQAHGRTGWIKPDGNAVHFISFEEQLAVVGKDAIIYFVAICRRVSDALSAIGRSSKRSSLLERRSMDLPHATIEEFAADGYTPIECYCPHCREIRLRPISWLPVSRLASPSLSFQPDYAVWSAEVLLRSAKPWRHKVNDVK